MPIDEIEPCWLRVEHIVHINKKVVARTNERHTLLRRELLESALAKPRFKWSYGETDVLCLAVSLLHGIARNHCFDQGNKRTATIAAIMFIEDHGYRWMMPDTKALGQRVEALILNNINEDRLADWMRQFVEPV